MDKSRKRSAARAPTESGWLWAGGGLATVAAIGLAAAGLLPVSGNDASHSPAGLCPHYDVDPNTGMFRDRGLAPCDVLAQSGRIDMIRKGFTER